MNHAVEAWKPEDDDAYDPAPASPPGDEDPPAPSATVRCDFLTADFVAECTAARDIEPGEQLTFDYWRSVHLVLDPSTTPSTTGGRCTHLRIPLRLRATGMH